MGPGEAFRLDWYNQGNLAAHSCFGITRSLAGAGRGSCNPGHWDKQGFAMP